MKMRSFTLDEVKVHNGEKDCWIVIRDFVYDVTEFLELHPGGKEVLLKCGGTDCTGEFEEIMHSDAAEKLMEKYLVGRYSRLVVKEVEED
ncbi:MAG: hypothetical protein Hyperionvirus15_43 [Hyperionvirus sp.]|uniref:Cytochrome b5 heme-binding domain-containing protein n=1 Tax=Hyperionvirus sp. TaxID=2487770 RepID=A0A3G5A9U4_9VIRU|nr:MAG: hypothetical protein Hyperionvirus15_43 [Hyperionvirus sp.]